MAATSALSEAGRARAVAGTDCVILGLAPLHRQLFDASARLTLNLRFAIVTHDQGNVCPNMRGNHHLN